MAQTLPVNPQHQEFLDEHFQGGVESDWKAFHRKLRSKAFADSVRKDPRADPKLKRFTKMVNARQSSRQEGIPVSGSTGNVYKVRYHPELKRFSCSCRDWTYARSHKNRGSTGDCKHIKQLRQGVGAPSLEKTATSLRGRAAKALLMG